MSPSFAIFGLGPGEIVLILVVVLLLFGAKKLPELARGLGQGIKEFKKASNEVTNELHRSIDDDDEPPAPKNKRPSEGDKDTASKSDSSNQPPH